MKVGQALRLLPDIDLAPPMRAALLSSARDAANLWGSGAAYATIGTRDVSADDVRETITRTLAVANHHLGEVWERYASALERIDRNDGAGAVTDLLHNGAVEQGLGRLSQAAGWYAVARAVAEELADRRPEVETLLAGAKLGVILGYYEEAARGFQRALALAEADGDAYSAAHAAKGLGDVALRRAMWTGAQSWFSRALTATNGTGDATLAAETQHALGELARRMGDFPSAREALGKAREMFETLGDTRDTARVLATLGLLEIQAGDATRAAAALLEALAWARRARDTAGLESFIRLSIARLFVSQRRFLEAEQELRRAEALAVASDHLRRLAHIYCVFGTARGLQGDETGFVFFEQALQISRMLSQWPIVEARVRRDYATFRQHLGATGEARAHLQRAHELFARIGATADADRVRAELAWLPG